MGKLEKVYSKDFYDQQIAGSYRSAKVYVEYLSKIYLPHSVVDVGCGRGAWLKAFKEAGTQRLHGFDGAWNTQQNMVDDSIVFVACDLNQPIVSNVERFDLAMSLEVAEHLESASAKTFVRSLTALSDVVLFGAAFTEQGGSNHINEQPHTYWAKHFDAEGYAPFDMFRPVFWGDRRVDFWYRQNTFLYVRKDSVPYGEFVSKDFLPIANIDFMDCVHPSLYLYPSIRKGVRMIFRTIMRAVKRRIAPTPQRN